MRYPLSLFRQTTRQQPVSILVHTHDGAALTLEPNPGDTLAHTIFLSRIWRDVALCSGLGKCGLCKVRYISDAPEPTRDELKKLGQDALDIGWRLACLHPSETCEIEIPKPVRSQRMLRMRGTDVGDYALAVDLGTTSIHSSVLINGKQKAVTQELNPQAGMGSEVMSALLRPPPSKDAPLSSPLLQDNSSISAKRLKSTYTANARASRYQATPP